MKPTNTLVLLLTIVVIGTGLRFLGLNHVPPHLSNDEISIAYDAYSLSLTGRDEHNHPLPLSFQSHNTYKAPLYAYLLSPLTHIFGNTNVVAKLPSALLGSLTILVFFFITYLLTKNRRLSLLSCLVLAISPWHINISHSVLESNVALFFLSLGIVYLLREKSFFSALFLSLSVYGYHTEWGLVPALAISAYFLVFRKKSAGKFFLALTFVFCLPLFINYLHLSAANTRASSEVIWNDPQIQTPLKIVQVFVSNYFSYNNPGYLFFSGLGLFNNHIHPYQFGLFLWPLILPFFIGLSKIKDTVSKKFFWFFIIWILSSPIVPSLTSNSNILIRNLPAVLPYSMLISFGMYWLLKSHKQMFSLVLFLSFAFLALFLPVYIFHFPIETASTYQGYMPIAAYLKSHSGQFTSVRIDDRFGVDNQFIGVPHLYFAYYNRFDPKTIQNRLYLKDATYYGNYAVTWIDWSKIRVDPNTWYVVGIGNHPSPEIQIKLKFIAGFPDAGGRPAFEIWTGRN
jgi:4-amino-4-deoxy-L-arabinose transferase-like glycosyltransferase